MKRLVFFHVYYLLYHIADFTLYLQYQIGQLFGVIETSKKETGGGEGVEVQKNEPFEDVSFLDGQYTKGQYTKKIYHLESKVPSLVRLFAPTGSMTLHEEAWNAYPYCKTVVTNPDYMKEAFKLTVESLHAPDQGTQENVFHLTPEQLKEREVIFIDIAKDTVDAASYKAEEDPSKFKSEKTGRGPLSGDWRKTAEPVMCAYKLVSIDFEMFLFQGKVESYSQEFEQKLFLNFHRQVFCTIDKWHDLTMEDIRALEEHTKHELDEQRQTGEKTGNISAD